MKVILFDRTEKQIGRLISDLVNPREIEDLNGDHRFLFTYPVDADWAESIVTGNLVAIQDMDNNWQLYEIIQAHTKISSSNTIEATCEHVYYALGRMEFVSLDLTSAEPAAALTQALTNTGWEPGTIEVSGTRTSALSHITPLKAVRRLASLWECELRFRVTLSGTGIQAKYVDMLIRRGSYTGKRFEFGKDIHGIDIIVDRSNLVTALYGWGQGQEIDPETGEVERITLADVEWVKGQPAELYPGGPTSSAPVDKPLGQLWIGDPDALVEHGQKGADGNPAHVFGEYNSQAGSPQALAWATWNQLQKRITPLVNIQATVSVLEQIEGFEHEKVRLGDTCIAKVPDVEPLEARVIRIDRQRKDPDQTAVELGNFRPANVDKLSDIERRQQDYEGHKGIWDRAKAFTPEGKLPTSSLDGVIDAVKNQILAGGGSVKIDGDGLWVTDTGDPATALGAVRGVAYNGEAALVLGSRHSDIDPWNWRVGMTSEGFKVFAEDIDVEDLSAIAGNFTHLQAGDNDSYVKIYKHPENTAAHLDFFKKNIVTGTGGEISQSARLSAEQFFIQETWNGDCAGESFLEAPMRLATSPNGVAIDRLDTYNMVFLLQALPVSGLVKLDCYGDLLQIQDNLEVLGDLTAGSANINGNLTAASADISGELTIKGGMNVYDAILQNYAMILAGPESGSNSNGSYVRFRDGTQICWGTFSQSISWGSSGSLFVSSVLSNQTFPASFSANPIAYGFIKISETLPGAIRAATTTYVNLRFYSPISLSTKTRTIYWLAIGRWK